MAGYLPWDKSWRRQIIYLPWVQPEIRGMENSPVLPSYPIFADSLRRGAGGYGFFTAIASAMVFLIGHEPEASVNALYCEWLRVFNAELASQLFYEGTEMTTKYDLPQAVWMLQASLLLEPESYETNYNLALAFEHLAAKLTREEKFIEAGDCRNQAQQYYRNASQIKSSGSAAGAPESGAGLYKYEEKYDHVLRREW
ncbi:MAG: hypothetical protein FWF83_00080 [Clostridiales bacterium]|nr:hypothetical protein [Clostridiales bacterium]